jgi:hypothetical protein
MGIAEITQLIGAIAGLGSLIGVIILWRKARWEAKKEEASAAEQYEGLAERTLKKLNTEIENNQQLRADVNILRREVAELKAQVTDYERGIDLLIAQLELNNYTPVWKPHKRAT